MEKTPIENSSEQIKKLKEKLETRGEMITARNARITELTAQVEILMRVIKES